MTRTEKDYLIIGDSAAGVSAAEQIRCHDQKGSLLIISREPYPAYGRPLISYLLEGKIDEEHIWYKDADFYNSKEIDVLRGPSYEAIKLDADEHKVTLKNGDEITYRKCLLATGGESSKPPIKNLENARNVFPFITLDQAKSVQRAALEAHEIAHAQGRKSRAVIIGAGLIGLKAAEALISYVDEVIIVSRRWVLPAILDPQAGQILQDVLTQKGIVCLTHAAADDATLEKGLVTEVLLKDGSRLDCDIIIAALGVKPNTSLAVQAGAQEGKGLVCGADLQTTLTDVFVAGDVAQVNNVLDGTKSNIALWQSAVHQGKAVGSFMAQASSVEPFAGGIAVNSTYFFDFSLLSCGITNPAEESGYTVHVCQEDDRYAKFVTKDDRLMGYILLNRPEKAGIYTSIIEEQIPLSSFKEDIFSRIPTNLDFSSKDRWVRLHEGCPQSCDFETDEECK